MDSDLRSRWYRNSPLNKAGWVRWTDARLRCTRSESLRRTFLVQGEQDSGLHSKSFRPCAGRRVEKPRRLSSKLRLKPPSLVDGSSAADRTLSDLPFPGAGGRGWRPRFARLIACQCVSLVFRFGGHSQQLPAF